VRKFLDRWTRDLVRRGLRAGLIEGSNLWLSIASITWLVRVLVKRPPPQVRVERLRLGESLMVSHVPAPPRSRRARRKADRQAAKLKARQAKDEASRETRRKARRGPSGPNADGPGGHGRSEEDLEELA